MTLSLSDNAKSVIERRISPRDENNNPLETAEQVFRRVANFVAQGDEKYIKADSEIEKQKKIKTTEETFYNMMANQEFLPNSPTLVNAGRPLGQLSACFVLPVEDNMEGVFDSVKNAALIHKTGGGTGFSFSRLRPEGNRVDVTSGIASGPVSFMGVFDKATEVIKQGGTRRGANMGILRVDHPDILKFIEMKSDNVSLQNFNISVGVTDVFMEALKSGGKYELVFNGHVYDSIYAEDVWNKIIDTAWLTGDPGVVFIDRINSGRANPVPTLGPIEATNPCGEQPLYPYDSCNLGSINLSVFVKLNNAEDQVIIDYPRLKECIWSSVHFLDNVIEMNKYPIPEIQKMSDNIRRIGLGVMGWANALIALSIPYDSEEARNLAGEVSKFIQIEADNASRFYGTMRGAFPLIGESIYSGEQFRNSTRTTIAPTGTISIIADCSSGIEPLYGLAFVRSHYLDNDDPNKRYEMIDVNKYLLAYLEDVGYTGEELGAVVKDIISTGDAAKYLPEEVRDVFVTAHDISLEGHVLMQAAWQKHTDNAVSKTINLPNSATGNDVCKAYMLAWDTGCMGVTVYRDGSKDMQVLSHVSGLQQREESTDMDESDDELRREEGGVREQQVSVYDGTTKIRLDAKPERKQEDTTGAVIHKFMVGDFKGRVILGTDEYGNPREVFIIGNKVGSSTRGYLDTIGILTSVALQNGVSVEEIAEKLVGTRFEPSGRTSSSDYPMATSVVDYVFNWLAGFSNQRVTTTVVNTENSSSISTKRTHGDLCPDCGEQMFYGEGCFTCVNGACGFTKCG